jgi:glycosyltransferase involved in cell wall biosynthesis
MSPIKLFEAWAAGVPVIATGLGSLRRLVRDGETGLLVGDDPAEVAAAVLRLQGDAQLRARLAAAGRAEVARHYNWDRAAAEVGAVLERVVATS